MQDILKLHMVLFIFTKIRKKVGEKWLKLTEKKEKTREKGKRQIKVQHEKKSPKERK